MKKYFEKLISKIKFKITNYIKLLKYKLTI